MKIDDIRPKLTQLRRSQADLARHLELDPSSLTKSLKGERRFQAAEIIQLEKFFGEKLDLELDATAPSTPRRALNTKIPLYGYAAMGGDDRIAYTEDRVLDWIDPPPFWNGAGDLVYIRLVGESMEPRYFSGEIIPVKLNFPPAKNQDALIVFSDHTAIVKNYQGQRDGRVFARQYNEARTLDFDATKVQGLHAVWKPGF